MNPEDQFQIIVPDIGAEEQPVHLSCWLVDVGDWIEEGDRVVEMVLNGMTFDISSTVSGELRKILQPEKSALKSGMCLGYIRKEIIDSEGN